MLVTEPHLLLLLIQSNIFDLQIYLLVHLVLAGSRLLAGTNTLVVGLIVHPSRFMTASEVSVTIAKAQHPWIVVVGSPTSLHPIDLSLSSKDRDTLEHISGTCKRRARGQVEAQRRERGKWERECESSSGWVGVVGLGIP